MDNGELESYFNDIVPFFGTNLQMSITRLWGEGVGGSNRVMRETPVMRLDWLAAASRNMEGKYWRESRFRCDADVNEQVIGLGFI